MLGKLSEWPFQYDILSRDTSAKSKAFELKEVAGHTEIRALKVGFESRRRPHRAVEWSNGIGETAVSIEEAGRGIGDVERRWRPVHRSAQGGKTIFVHSEDRTGKCPRQVATVLEQVERAADFTLPPQLPFFILEEDFAHPRELSARLELICLLRPVTQVDVTGGYRFRTIGVELDVVQVNEAAVENELRLHVRPERDEILNRHRTAIERGRSMVVRDIHDVDVHVWSHHAPGRLVIFERKLPPPRSQKLQRRDEALGSLRF